MWDWKITAWDSKIIVCEIEITDLSPIPGNHHTFTRLKLHSFSDALVLRFHVLFHSLSIWQSITHWMFTRLTSHSFLIYLIYALLNLHSCTIIKHECRTNVVQILWTVEHTRRLVPSDECTLLTEGFTEDRPRISCQGISHGGSSCSLHAFALNLQFWFHCNLGNVFFSYSLNTMYTYYRFF